VVFLNVIQGKLDPEAMKKKWKVIARAAKHSHT